MRIPSLAPPVLYIVLVVFAALYGGVVLPAVWSRRPGRRNAALKVLTVLVGVLRSRRTP